LLKEQKEKTMKLEGSIVSGELLRRIANNVDVGCDGTVEVQHNNCEAEAMVREEERCKTRLGS
jgi:hypothetical protein